MPTKKKQATPAITLHEILNTTYQSRWVGTAKELQTYDMALGLVERMEGVEDLSVLGWGKLRGWLLAKGQAASTINRKRSIWRVLCRTAVEMGIIPVVPNTRQELVQEGAIRFLTGAEEIKLLSALHAAEREICVILLYTGLRRSEFWKLKWADVHWEARHIQIHQTKTGKRRFIPLPKRVYQILENRFNNGLECPAGKLNHWTFIDHFVNAVETAGCAGVTIHTLRHTYASRLAQNGVPLLMIQKLLGHSNPVSTMIYAHLAEGQLESVVLDTFDKEES